eukprot:GEMP01020221.1.p1 GENE.GEMP01020221.1~~GEMP01020221.1.p1  ORF type:complete len:209 (+),score=46.59 GEMP01020221.1:89-715(+)
MVSPRPNTRKPKRPNRCAPYPDCLTIPPPPPHNTTQYLMEDYAQRTPSSSSCDGASSSSPIMSMLKYDVDDLLARLEGDDSTIPSMDSPASGPARLSQCAIPSLELTNNDISCIGEGHAAERCLDALLFCERGLSRDDYAVCYRRLQFATEGHLFGAHARKSSCTAREVSFFIQGTNTTEDVFPTADIDDFSSASGIIDSANGADAGS